MADTATAKVDAAERVHVARYFAQVAEVAARLDHTAIDAMATALAELRDRDGRLFFVGVGGSAGNCSHAVNDFRKLCGIEAYAPTDNVSELTARTNDEGWETVFSEWLVTSRAKKGDALFVMSVGGGNLERGVSVNIVRALELAAERGMTIFGIVGRDGGYTKRLGQHVVVVPTVDEKLVTPHTEAFHAVIWHCLVSHPRLQQRPTKW
jgi:D-sedoheptulose 7-phosphate isomerase